MSEQWEDFEATTPEKWREAIIRELKGADYDQHMRWQSPEGIVVEPFYMPGETEAIVSVPVTVHPALIAEYIKVSAITSANKNALSALEGGAQVIIFDLDHREIDSNEVTALLEGIFLNIAAVYFLHPENAKIICDVLDKKQARGSKVLLAECPSDLILNEHIYLFADIRPIHYRGGNMVEELAEGLCQAHEMLGSLIDKGFSPEMAANKICFLVPCGNRYLFEISKCRALRWLWTSLCNQYGVPIQEVPILSESSSKDFSSENVYLNMIRNTTQVMAAALGGASVIYAHPHEISSGHPGFGERIARNIQHLLQLESGVSGDTDIVGGAWFFDSITQQLAEKAWDRFRGEA